MNCHIHGSNKTPACANRCPPRLADQGNTTSNEIHSLARQRQLGDGFGDVEAGHALLEDDDTSNLA